MIFSPDISSIVFDMDGVLWHSSAIHTVAYRMVLEEAGLGMPDYATIAGRRTDEVMRHLVASQRALMDGPAAKAAVAALTDAKQTRARQMLRERPPLALGCAAVVGALARSKALALASSASPDTVELFLQVSGTRSLFKAVVSGGDVAAAKPDPAIYIEALRRLGCEPARAAVVEDAASGVRAARSAGIAFVVGIDGTATADDLLAAGARHVVGTLQDLVAQ